LNDDFSRWLEQHFLAWQHRAGTRCTQADFAKFLGVSPVLLSHYLNGRRKPSNKVIVKLAERLDPTVYDLFALLRPDPGLRFISLNWHKVEPNTQAEIIGMIMREVD
jgi:transcriptional regulator with XRE-family HTH domain